MNSPLSPITDINIGHVCLTTNETLKPPEPSYTEIQFILDPTLSDAWGAVRIAKLPLLTGAYPFDNTVPFALIQMGEGAEWETVSYSGSASYDLYVKVRTLCTIRMLSTYGTAVTFSAEQLEEVLWEDVPNLIELSFKGSTNLKKVPSFLPPSVNNLTECFSAVEGMDWEAIQTWDTSNVQYMESVFYKSTLNLQSALKWDFSSAVVVYSMFAYCTQLAVDIPFHNLNPSKGIDLGYLFTGCKNMGEATISLGSLDQYESIEFIFSQATFSGKGLESAGYADDDVNVRLKNGESAFEYATLTGDAKALVSNLNFSKLTSARAMFCVFSAGTTDFLSIPKMENIRDGGSAFFGASFRVAITHDYPELVSAGSMFSGVQEIKLEKMDAKFPKVTACNSMFAVIRSPLPDMSQVEMNAVLTPTNLFGSSTVTSNPPRMANASVLTTMYSKSKFQIDTLDLSDFSKKTDFSFIQTFMQATMDDLEVIMPLTQYSSLTRTFEDATWTGRGNIGEINVRGVSKTNMANTFLRCTATCDVSGWCVEHITNSPEVAGWSGTALTGLPKWGEACGE